MISARFSLNSTLKQTSKLLVNLLQQTKALETEPELQFQPEEYASYEIANQTLKVINESGVTKFGFVGNEQFATFGKAGG